MTKTETIIIDEILNTVPNVGFKSPFLSSRIVNFILTPFQVKRTVTMNVINMSHQFQGRSVKLDIFPKKWIFYPAD